MKRGYVITWDAVISLTFVLFLMMGFIGLQYSIQLRENTASLEHLQSVAENALDTMDKRGVLEEIGRQWSLGNGSYAATLTKSNFDLVVPKHIGYRLDAVTEDNVSVIYDSGNTRPSERKSGEETRAMRFLSGYKENASRSGWAARAWLVENKSGVSTRVYNSSSCCYDGSETLTLQYSPEGHLNDTFYAFIPADSVLSSALFEFTWEGGIPSGTSTTTSVTGSTQSTTTTTTTTIRGCTACPAQAGCRIPGSYRTGPHKYNYHYFTLTKTCDVEVKVYTGVEENPYGTNMYDLYANWEDNSESEDCESHDCSGNGIFDNSCLCQCQQPPEDPQGWMWDCRALSYGASISGTTVSCDPVVLDPATYQVMVDCWDPLGGYDTCPGRYHIYIDSSDPECRFGRPPG